MLILPALIEHSWSPRRRGWVSGRRGGRNGVGLPHPAVRTRRRCLSLHLSSGIMYAACRSPHRQTYTGTLLYTYMVFRLEVALLQFFTRVYLKKLCITSSLCTQNPIPVFNPFRFFQVSVQ